MTVSRPIFSVLIVFISMNCVAVSAQGGPGSEISGHEIATAEQKLSYNRYSIRKRYRKVRIEEAVIRGRSYFDAEYAVITRRNRMPLRFDGSYSPMGNTVRFGLFSFLGNGRKQMLVSQDIFRGGTQWLVSLGKYPHVIYDGNAWGTGREIDDLSFVDLDQDGVYEIRVPICIFYGFASLSPGATPLPVIVFKYSKTARRYLPANPRFSDNLLADANTQQGSVSPVSDQVSHMNHLSDVLTIVLDYVFAGRAREAWTFYDQAYKLPDKVRMKKEIQAVLKHSPVYRFIYRKRSRRGSI